jgi:hypothetical protein
MTPPYESHPNSTSTLSVTSSISPGMQKPDRPKRAESLSAALALIRKNASKIARHSTGQSTLNLRILSSNFTVKTGRHQAARILWSSAAREWSGRGSD